MKVLIVDDDMVTVDVIKSTIDWKKLKVDHVYTAYQVEGAKKILKENEVDIVISDIEMPMGSGIELLGWIRSNKMDMEMILLTCHESFSYASNAVKLHAAEYLLKPFEPSVMEQVLQKLIYQIEDKRTLAEESMYGKWVKRNYRQLRRDFLNMLLEGKAGREPKRIQEEIRSRNLDIDVNRKYTLVISRITDAEQDWETTGRELSAFIVSNIHAESLCGDPENTFMLELEQKDCRLLVTVCEETAPDRLREMCRTLHEAYDQLLKSTLTCCICRPCRPQEFCDVYQEAVNILLANAVDYGKSFFAEEVQRQEPHGAFILELSEMEGFLASRNRMGFMSYLKRKLQEKVQDKTLTRQTLEQAREEILQAVYLYLAKRNLPASALFADETGVQMLQKAPLSVINMIRWGNYLVTRMYEYEEEQQKTQSVIEKIHCYIREHYQEDIGRNEIAAAFYLAPEYLSKMYKKQTGRSLKDYISEYRIEQAKILLERGGMRVSDVAEAVGIDNFAYFSTLFKKYTGMTPNQYRKS